MTKGKNPYYYLSPLGLAFNNTEDGHQAALITWARRAARIGMREACDNDIYGKPDERLVRALKFELWAQPELRWLHSIPNGGHRDPSVANIMKMTGVTAGVADLFLPARRWGHGGYYIELKVKGREASQDQKDFGEFVKSQGFAWRCLDGWINARESIISYLTEDNTTDR